MKNQVVSLELARELNEKLKSVGMCVKKPAHFYWCYDYAGYSNEDCPTEPEHELVYTEWYDSIEEAFNDKCQVDHHTRNSYIVKTYTLHEMLEMLPDNIDDNNDFSCSLCVNNNGAGYWNDTHNCAFKYFKSCDNNNSIEDSIAKLIMWGVNNGYVKGGEDG